MARRSSCAEDPSLDAAIEASEYEFAYECQLREVICLSDSELAFHLQLQEAIDNSTIAEPRLHRRLCPASPPRDGGGAAPTTSTTTTTHTLSYGPSLVTVNARQDQASTSQVVFVQEEEKGSLIVHRDGKEPAMEDDVLVPENVVSPCLEASHVSLPCIICLEMKREEDLFPGLDCNHPHCIPCLVRYVQFTVFEGKLMRLHCADTRCGETASVEACERFLPSAMAEQWKNLAIEQELAPESRRVYCPFKDCQAILIREDGHDDSLQEESNSAECPMCNRLFCMDCLVPWHADKSCIEYQNLPSDEKAYEDSLLKNLVKDKKWQRCSKCKFFIELKAGCNHMTCRCGYQFCYLCGDVWRSNQHLCKQTTKATY